MSAEEEDGFLHRWSRLKRETAIPAPEPEEEPAPEPAPAPDPEPLSEEDLAALPRIEDLAEGSDIRAFLRVGVPRQLRNAALRRMWMLTPSIRDYRDPAVDYAWDWNTPGGVPGDGAAPSVERATEMMRKLLGPREEIALERVVQETPETKGEEAARAYDIEAGPLPHEAEVAAQQAVEGTDPAPDTLPRRRHGSALPVQRG